MSVNPFNITTAVDYSDLEINTFWVDISLTENSIYQLLNPSSPMPMLILGGKGSGKTHIMRYFSFNSKKIRYEQNLEAGLKEDKYLGIYLRCGGLNSSRFKGGSELPETWKNLFAYYIELWFSQLLLQILDEIVNKLPKLREEEKSICQEITKSLFDVDLTSKEIFTFSELRNALREFQKQLDFEINNCSITGQKIVKLRIYATSGSLLFGIPQLLKDKIELFKDFQFIYLIDEYENLSEEQQQYINTLLRERKNPVTFRVGARWYGVRTLKTYSGEEEIKEGSEYEKHIIDRLFRENDKAYDLFVKEMCLKRLKESGYTTVNPAPQSNEFSQYLEDFDLKEFLQDLAEKEKIGHFETLRSKLKSTKLKVEEIDSIIDNLRVKNDLILERTNVMLFYRAWNKNKGSNLLKASEITKKYTSLYFLDEEKENTPQFKVLDKFRADIIDQLFRESQNRLPYTGFDKLVKMSNGIPRLLLITLKHIYRWSTFFKEHPFQKDLISTEAQIKGVDEATNWFLEDARMPGQKGKKVADIIKRLGQFLQELKFADTPPECSISTFSININDINDDIREVLGFLEQYSYIISVSDRTEKNSVRKFETYQINGIIAPKWDLSLYRRGIIQLSKEEVNAIFDNTEDNFEKARKAKMNKYYAPFSDSNGDLTLFED